MDQVNVLKKLEKLFWVIGWLLVASTLFGVGVYVYQYATLPTSGAGDFFHSLGQRRGEFQLFSALKTLLSGFGESFFAFLMSSIFTMAIHRRPVNQARAERFLKCTCLGWIGGSVIGIGLWIYSITYFFPQDYGSVMGLEIDYTNLAMQALAWGSGVIVILPILYAITVYVLFRQFSHLITFESETV